MKPLKLKLQAFGSFPGLEEINFDALGPRGLFVVAGDTGTGKTTIFDAMCWALYGKMPLKESGGVRSDHADADTETFVELTFECDGAHYVVTRRPEQLRDKKSGQGKTTQPASAGLVRVTSVGSESVSTKVTDTSARCAALVGLDAEQFQRVVLLPQGEFARFLLAPTPERESLLGKLFGGQVFDDMVEHLKTRRNDLASQLQNVEADIKAQLDSARENLGRVHEALGLRVHAAEPDADVLALADRQQLSTIRDAATEPLERIQTQTAELKHEADAATKAHSDAEAAARRFDETLRHLHAIDVLDVEQPEVTSGEVAAQASREARLVTTEATELVGARERATEATKVRDERVSEIAEALMGLGVKVDTSSAATITAALEDSKLTCGQQSALLRAQHEAAEARDKANTANSKAGTGLTAKVEALDAALARAKQIDEIELPQLREQGADPVTIQSEIDTTAQSIRRHQALDTALTALSRAREADRAASEIHREVFQAYVATQAPRMAERLIDGEPCPVCGSVDHPEPARSDNASTTSSADLEKAAAAQRQAASVVSELESKIAAVRAELGDDADVPVDELRAKHADLEEALGTAKDRLQLIDALEQELTKAQEQVQQLQAQIEGLRVTRRYTEEQLIEAEEVLVGANEAVEGIDAGEVRRSAKLLTDVSNRAAGLESLFVAVAETRSSISDCEQRLKRALDASKFETADEALAALLSPEDETMLLEKAQTHRTRRQEASTALRLLTEQGVPDTRPDLEHTETVRQSTQDAYDRLYGACTTAKNAANYCDTALNRHDALVSGSEGVRASHDLAEQTYTVCHGDGVLSMSLKRWVLTRELDRVTAAANGHLAHMTAGRYSLRRRGHVTDGRKTFGLDLEVLDATTGRPRSTTTLSGGEQFQASLSLALGLADVVSHGGSASGKRFEALFVDEGFGSLDPQSLDDAIEALHQLHATGRMVGAITHVEAMKQQLHVGIEVKRLPDGGGSTLVVKP